MIDVFLCSPQVTTIFTKSCKNNNRGGWNYGSVIKGTGGSSRGPEKYVPSFKKMFFLKHQAHA